MPVGPDTLQAVGTQLIADGFPLIAYDSDSLLAFRIKAFVAALAPGAISPNYSPAFANLIAAEPLPGVMALRTRTISTRSPMAPLLLNATATAS